MMMACLLASMKDASGRVLIEGFYDGIMRLTEADKPSAKRLTSTPT